MEHHLIAIIPSEDITIKIRKLRTQLFRKFGIVSARCLPEMIPVAFINTVIDKKYFQGITISEEIGSLSCISSNTNDIFLQISNSAFLDSLINRLQNYQKSGFINLKPGIYLGSEENGSNIREIFSYADKNKDPLFSWKKNNLELLKIETKDTLWWNNIQWETIWSQKIRFK